MGIRGEETLKDVKRNGRKAPETDCDMQCLSEKLCRVERMLLQKGKCSATKDTKVNIKDEEGVSHTDPINENARKKNALYRQAHDNQNFEKNYNQQIADLEEKILIEDDRLSNCFGKSGHKIERKKQSFLELYRNLHMLEEKNKCLSQKQQKPQEFQNKAAGMKCRMKNYSRSNPYNKGKKERISGLTCNMNPTSNNYTVRSCDEYERNLGMKSNRSKLNSSLERNYGKIQVPFAKTVCPCHNISSSPEESEESIIYNRMYASTDQSNVTSACTNNDDDKESESFSENQTLYSEMSKRTCYCSKNESHDESSGADSDYGEMYLKNMPIGKSKKERFRGGLDLNITHPKIATMKYDKRLAEVRDGPSATNIIVDKLKLLKVEELREGVERLKIRNRNLRDFLDTLQNPMNLVGKPSEANTICTRVSSCYTFDVARQTRSGLMTVVEILKGRCRSKDAVIVALADELKTAGNKRIDIQDQEIKNIITQHESLIWDGLTEKNDNGLRRKFTKKDSAIGFVVFLMILISHVKRSEMVSYLTATRKVFTESPFKLVLSICGSKSFSINCISYYHDFASSFQIFIKNSIDKWTNIMVKYSQWVDSYYVHLQQHLDVMNNFLITNQFYVLLSFSAFFVGILLLCLWTIWEKSIELYNTVNYEKTQMFLKSNTLKFIKFITFVCQQILTWRIFWLALGFYSQILCSSIQEELYRLLDSFKIYYIEYAENTLAQNLDETQVTADCYWKLFDRLDYSWLVSIFCNKFHDFVEFAYYIFKNI